MHTDTQISTKVVGIFGIRFFYTRPTTPSRQTSKSSFAFFGQTTPCHQMSSDDMDVEMLN